MTFLLEHVLRLSEHCFPLFVWGNYSKLGPFNTRGSFKISQPLRRTLSDGQIWTIHVLEKALFLSLFVPWERNSRVCSKCFCWFPAAMLVPSMASPFKSLQLWRKFSMLILFKKNCCVLSFPALWTLSIERIWLWFWSILNGVTLKISNTYTRAFNFLWKTRLRFFFLFGQGMGVVCFLFYFVAV